MSLGIKLDHVRGQGQTGGDRLARVTFRGKNMVPCKDNQGVILIKFERTSSSVFNPES